MTENTRTNPAQEYADKVAARMWADYEDGAPFGRPEDCDCGAADTWDEHDADHDYDGPAEPECPECEGCECEITAWDYLSDVLEIDYIVSSRGEYRGAEVTITIGGPYAYIDTRTAMIRVTWGGDTGAHSLPGETVELLDEALEDYASDMIM